MEEVTISEKKPQLVLGIRREGPYKMIPQLLKELFEFIMGGGAECIGPPVFVCHETAEEANEAMETEKADLEVAVPIAKEVEAPEGMKCYELPGGKFAVTLHRGPYEECESAYNKLFDWIRKNDMKVAGPTREYYLNDPNEVEPANIETEIIVPVE